MPELTNKSEEQKVAEAEVESFRQDLGPFVVAAETTRMPMVFTDAKEPGHPIIFAKDSTGGTVTVGTQRSEVQSGHVRRIEGHCYSGRMELTGEEVHVGGRVFRGPAH